MFILTKFEIHWTVIKILHTETFPEHVSSFSLLRNCWLYLLKKKKKKKLQCILVLFSLVIQVSRKVWGFSLLSEIGTIYIRFYNRDQYSFLCNTFKKCGPCTHNTLKFIFSPSVRIFCLSSKETRLYFFLYVP